MYIHKHKLQFVIGFILKIKFSHFPLKTTISLLMTFSYIHMLSSLGFVIKIWLNIWTKIRD